jgi:hypothetical protein
MVVLLNSGHPVRVIFRTIQGSTAGCDDLFPPPAGPLKAARLEMTWPNREIA